MLNIEDVTKLYVATLNRAPDADGLNYWVYDSGLTLEEVAISFFDQPEAQKLYPSSFTNDAFVDAVYRNLFNREADIVGKNYWVNQLDKGIIGREQFILAVINGALGSDTEILNNKMSVGLNFAKNGLSDVKLAYDVLQNIGSSDLTVYAANKEIDYYTLANDVNTKDYFMNSQKISLEEPTLSTLPSSQSLEISALQSGSKWNSNVVTYSFNETIPSEYFNDSTLTNNWHQFTERDKQIAREAFNSIESFSNIIFKEVDYGGDIRFNKVDMQYAGFAYLPGTFSLNGDVWISNNYDDKGNTPGTYGYLTIYHEIGHAIGLKHPFDGSPVLPVSVNDEEHTVMSYTQKQDLIVDYGILNNQLTVNYLVLAEPKGYSLYDIAAIQNLYGVDETSKNSGNTVYDLSDLYNNHEHVTLWDVGGEDTLDLTKTQMPNRIDLRSGEFSGVDIHDITTQMNNAIDYYVQQNVRYNQAKNWVDDIFLNPDADGLIYTGESNLSIAYGTVIENVFTGTGNDIVTDNMYDNIIATGGGDDIINLYNGGMDIVDGGNGNDKIYFDFSYQNANVVRVSDSRWFIDASDDQHTFVFAENIEQIEFTDFTMNLL